MTLPRSASSKRTNLPRASDYSKSFRKDWERLSHSGRFDLKRLKQLMILLIANGGPLGPEWLDHALAGEWIAHRECHIGGDFLLIYRLDGKAPNDVTTIGSTAADSTAAASPAARSAVRGLR